MSQTSPLGVFGGLGSIFTGSWGGFVPLRSFCTIGSIESSDGKYVLNVVIGELTVALGLW